MLRIFVFTIIFCCCAMQGFGKDLKIITTIKPFQSLIAGIIDKKDQVSAMITGDYSHHNFALKPSQIRKIYQSDAVVFMNPNFENFMRSAYNIFPDTTKIVTLSNTPQVDFLAKQNKHSAKHQDQALFNPDYHIWLSPQNAIKMVRYLTNTFIDINAKKKAIYQSNSQRLIKQLQALDVQLKEKLMPVKTISFMAFHNAYQYFIKDYQLNYAGSLTHDPMAYATINSINKAKEIMLRKKARCVFKEPQFSDKMIETVIQNNNVGIGILDPLGGHIAEGGTHYFQLLNNLTDNLLNCLKSHAT